MSSVSRLTSSLPQPCLRHHRLCRLRRRRRVGAGPHPAAARGRAGVATGQKQTTPRRRRAVPDRSRRHAAHPARGLLLRLGHLPGVCGVRHRILFTSLPTRHAGRVQSSAGGCHRRRVRRRNPRLLLFHHARPQAGRAPRAGRRCCRVCGAVDWVHDCGVGGRAGGCCSIRSTPRPRVCGGVGGGYGTMRCAGTARTEIHGAESVFGGVCGGWWR